MAALTKQQMEDLWKYCKTSITETCAQFDGLAKSDCVAAIRNPKDQVARERAERTLAMSDALNGVEPKFRDILCLVWSKLVLVNTVLAELQSEPQPVKDKECKDSAPNPKGSDQLT